jgi:iron complex outermembrane receptor protein
LRPINSAGAASALFLAGAIPALAHAEAWDATAAATAPIVVTRKRLAAPLVIHPQTTEGVSAAQVQATTNVSTVEDTLKYLPDVLIRQRHIGDTQAPITTRTSGVGASARSLVYVDDVLVSALIGNNNSTASPRWDLISPEAVEQVDVMYGPFSAAYPGNSIGEVVQITTRMPDRLEASATVEGAWQGFSQYGTRATYPTGRISATVGDRIGRAAFWLSAVHLDTQSQPLFDVTALTPSGPSAAGAPVTGSFAGANRAGAPVQILGVGGLEHQVVDSANLKLGYDITPAITATYSLGFYRNIDRAGVQTYLRGAGGAPVYAGALNIAGYAYTVPASAFSSDLYRYEEDHLAQSLTLRSHGGRTFDWEITASTYDYLTDRQRTPSGALPAAFAGGPGVITSLDGTGWRTIDARGDWRPQGLSGTNQISFGVHADQFRLESPKFNTADWTSGAPTTTASLAKGRTETTAAWLQDVVTLAPVTLTLGARYEHWTASGGVNASLSPALNVNQPRLSADTVSPKAVLAYAPNPDWRFTASIGQAYRFPTVQELYQAVNTGGQVSVPDPNLKPEAALSEELAAERTWRGDDGAHARLRLSLFQEDVTNALISQSATLVPGSPALFSFVQNVGHTRVRGVELVGEAQDIWVKGLSLSGWVTYVDSAIVADRADPRAVGKQLPQLPHLRAGAVESWRVGPKLTLSLAERYSDQAFGTIENTDPVANTYTGFAAFFVADIHAQYRLSDHITADVGVDNLNARRYFLFHPFPQRTVVAQLKYVY